jgi:hypothetical protein
MKNMSVKILFFCSLNCTIIVSTASGQNDNNLYFGGTARASFTTSKPISSNPWTQSVNQYDMSLKPEIGLVSADGSRYFGFGLGLRLGKGTMFNVNEKLLGGIVGAYYRKVFTNKSPLMPYIEGGLSATIGQTKTQQVGSEFFSTNISSKIGLMYAPENKWRFFLGMNIFSLDYERYASTQLFRVGIHNAGAMNLSLIRLF